MTLSRFRFFSLLLAGAAAVLQLAAPLSEAAAQADFLEHGRAPDWDATLARGKTYEVDFTTDEGTWMSVDISPDGQWVVFDLLGHIYRMPATGGNAECLTQSSGVALNFHPRFSPDGRRIAFVSDRAGQNSLWTMDANGGRPQPVFLDPVSRITSPTWMPDGHTIIAVREFPTYSMHRRSARIWRFPLDRAAEQPEELVGEPSGTQSYWPTVSADGSAMYYMVSTFAEPLHGLQRYQHIRRFDFDTKRVSVVTTPGDLRHYWPTTTEELAPEVSPDGKWLAFARRIPGAPLVYRGHTFNGRTALWLRDLATGAERVLRDPITFDMHEAHGMKNLRVLPGYAWAKDSRSIVLWEEGHIQRVSLDGQAQQIPFVARVKRAVSEQARWRHGVQERWVGVRNIRWPTLSAATGQIIFEALGEIWSIDSARKGASAQPLVPWTAQANYAMPAVSPDGRRLVFLSWSDAELGEVWTCELPVCRPEKISRQPARYLHPTWDAQGEGVFVVRSRGATAQQIASADTVAYDLVRLTFQAEKLIRAGVAPGFIATGPQGRIYDTTSVGQVNVQGHLEDGIQMPESYSVLQSIDPDQPGTPRPHASFPSAKSAVPSRDGRFVAYEENFSIFLAPLTRDTAEYVPAQSNAWRGAQPPIPIIKEDPLHHAVSLSIDGGSYVRWADDTRVIYSSADKIHIYDTASRTERVVSVAIKIPAAVPPADAAIVLQGGRIIDIDKAAVIEKGDVVVIGTRIRCVGQCATPAGAKIINVAGKTLIPGLVDVHAHGYYESAVQLLPQRFTASALYLSHGVTTVLDPAATSYGVFALAEMIEAGRMVGPRTYSTGEEQIPQAPQTGYVDYAGAGVAIRRLANLGAHSIKNFLQPRRDQRQMIGDWGRKLGLSVTNEGADLYYNVSAALDGHTGFEHPMHYMTMYRDVSQFFARTRTVYSPTLMVAGGGLWSEDYYEAHSDLWNNAKLRRFLPWTELIRHTTSAVRPKSEYTFPFLAEAVKDLREAGGYAAIGGHGELWGLDSHWELWSYAEAQSPMQVLQMGTLGGARMLGLESELGSIATGKLADIVILDSNPLDDIHNSTDIHRVMKGGTLYDGDTLDEVWPAQRPYGMGAWYDAEVFRNAPAEIR